MNQTAIHPNAVTPEFAAKWGAKPRTDLKPMTDREIDHAKRGVGIGGQQWDKRGLKELLIEAMKKFGEFTYADLAEHCCCKEGTVKASIQDRVDDKLVGKVGIRNKKMVYKWIGKV